MLFGSWKIYYFEKHDILRFSFLFTIKLFFSLNFLIFLEKNQQKIYFLSKVSFCNVTLNRYLSTTLKFLNQAFLESLDNFLLRIHNYVLNYYAGRVTLFGFNDLLEFIDSFSKKNSKGKRNEQLLDRFQKNLPPFLFYLFKAKLIKENFATNILRALCK